MDPTIMIVVYLLPTTPLFILLKLFRRQPNPGEE